MFLQGGQSVATRQGTDLHPTRRRQLGAYKATNGTGTDYAHLVHFFSLVIQTCLGNPSAEELKSLAGAANRDALNFPAAALKVLSQ
jgi:hypothetical protein